MTQRQRGDADLPPGPARDLVALLRLLRGRTTLTVGQISVKSHLAAGHVSEVLRGWKAPSPNAAEALARALGADHATTLKARALAEALAELNRHTRARKDADKPADPPNVLVDVPPPPSHFLGRSAELSRIAAAIRAARSPHRAAVAQIYGAAGIGKTALACVAAHELRADYPDGCLFVDFADLDDPSAVYGRLLARLGVAAASVPDDPMEARALYLSHLYRRSVLIVADNVTGSEQAARLVAASPSCALITVSRRHLDSLDECCAIRLEPLAPRESALLLGSLLEASGVSGTELARVAEATGGVPLAIREAAMLLRGPDPDPESDSESGSDSETADRHALSGRAAVSRSTARTSASAGNSRSTEPIPESVSFEYPLRQSVDRDKSIGIITGDLRRVRNVDVWVNSENTDMKMARVEEYTISAIVRYDGSVRDGAGRVIEDTIADELARRVDGLCPLMPGTAVMTGSGQLAVSNNVSAIVHVAAVYGEPGAGYRQISDVGRCITSALAEVDRASGHDRDVTVLFPLLGTGQGRGSIERTAAVLVGTAAEYLTKTSATHVSTVWFLAHTYGELAALQAAIEDNPLIAAG